MMATVDFKEFADNLLLPNGKDVSFIKIMLLYDERVALIRRVERLTGVLRMQRGSWEAVYNSNPRPTNTKFLADAAIKVIDEALKEEPDSVGDSCNRPYCDRCQRPHDGVCGLDGPGWCYRHDTRHG
jgi:hypothetical protein